MKIRLNKLKNIEKLIVGGAKVSSALNTKLQAIGTAVFETYGMTETVSHIAVKQLNCFKSDNKCYSERSEESNKKKNLLNKLLY